MNPRILWALSDAELARCAKEGVPYALDELFRRHRPTLVQRSAKTLGSLQNGEDAAQEALLKAYRKIHQLEDVENVAGWLARIAQNVCLDRIRQKKRKAAVDDAVPLEAVYERPHNSSLADGVAAKLALMDLPLPLREAALMTAAGYSSFEVADLTGVSAPTVRDRMRRARRSLDWLRPHPHPTVP